MEPTNFKIHDVIKFEQWETEKGPDYWGKDKCTGVVMAIGEHSLSIKDDKGETIEYRLKPETHTVEVSHYSPIQFGEDIEKAKQSIQREITRLEESLVLVTAWQVVYTAKISWFDNLIRHIKNFSA
jgi:hypothetical protein